MGDLGYRAGLIAETDYIGLSPGLIYEGKYLYDRANGARHKLSRVASTVVMQLVEPISWSEFKLRVRRKYLASETIRKIFNFLDSIGGLVVSRNWFSHLSNIYYWINMMLHGLVLDKPARRYKVSLRGGISAVRLAMRSVVILMVAAAVFGYGANISIRSLVIAIALFYFVLLSSTVIHELVHLHIYMSNRRPSDKLYQPVFLQRGLRIGLIHSAMASNYELKSAIAGPLSGLVFAGLFAGLSAFSISWFAWMIAVSVAIFHLVSWLPMYGDGKIIWSAMRTRYI